MWPIIVVLTRAGRREQIFTLITLVTLNKASAEECVRRVDVQNRIQRVEQDGFRPF